MKAVIFLLVSSLVTPVWAVFGQDESQPSERTTALRGGSGGRGGGFGRGNAGGFGGAMSSDAEFAQFDNAKLPKFDLDFPGGTPGALVEGIVKASGKPLNAIIPTEFRQTELPALRMKGVTVPQLFQALQMASLRTEPFVTGTSFGAAGNRINSITYQNTGYGFRTAPTADPENPVWYFYVARPGEAKLIEPPPKVCRFYQLAPYLERHSIDDITTAIQTGWKMLGDPSPPTMNFHKDTQLLIAVGEAAKLNVIDAALAELSGTTKSDTKAPAPKSTGRD